MSNIPPVQVLGYLGDVSVPLYTLNRAPLTTDYHYPIGTIWIDTLGQESYELVGKPSNVANWVHIGGTPGQIESLTGNDAVAVMPDPATQNVFVVGNNVQGINITGNALTYTMTVAGIDATNAQKGVVELATDAEAIAGALNTVVITPASLAAKLGAQTQFGVAVGNTTAGAVAWTAAGTNGQTLIGNTGANPSFAGIGTLSGLNLHGVVIAQNAGAFTATAAGTTGQLFHGVTGADPIFENTSNGNFSFIATAAADIGATRTLTISHADNTNAASSSQLLVSVGGAAGGNPYETFTVTGGQSFASGIVNGATPVFQLTSQATLGANVVMQSSTAGEVTFPNTTAFLAILSATAADQTGDGTVVSLICDTEIYDQNADYAAGILTAPVTGRYKLGTMVTLLDVAAGHTASNFTVFTTNRGYIFKTGNVGAMMNVGENKITLTGTVMADMDAGDQAFIQLAVNNAAKVVDFEGHASNALSAFYGNLEC